MTRPGVPPSCPVPVSFSGVAVSMVQGLMRAYTERPWRNVSGRSGRNNGYIFPGAVDRPINLDSFARWQFVPVLHRCGVCEKPKHLHRHADHEYKRDESLPSWKGWHGFRRGSAGYLARSVQTSDGVDTPAFTCAKPMSPTRNEVT